MENNSVWIFLSTPYDGLKLGEFHSTMHRVERELRPIAVHQIKPTDDGNSMLGSLATVFPFGESRKIYSKLLFKKVAELVPADTHIYICHTENTSSPPLTPWVLSQHVQAEGAKPGKVIIDLEGDGTL